MFKGVYPQKGDCLNDVKPYIIEDDSSIKWICSVE
jgi:hypothetical protein